MSSRSLVKCDHLTSMKQKKFWTPNAFHQIAHLVKRGCLRTRGRDRPRMFSKLQETSPVNGRIPGMQHRWKRYPKPSFGDGGPDKSYLLFSSFYRILGLLRSCFIYRSFFPNSISRFSVDSQKSLQIYRFQ